MEEQPILVVEEPLPSYFQQSKVELGVTGPDASKMQEKIRGWDKFESPILFYDRRCNNRHEKNPFMVAIFGELEWAVFLVDEMGRRLNDSEIIYLDVWDST